MSTSDGSSMRSLSEISEEETVRLSIDLVAAARRNLGFFRLVTESQWLQERPIILESIRRFITLLQHDYYSTTSSGTAGFLIFFFSGTISYGCH